MGFRLARGTFSYHPSLSFDHPPTLVGSKIRISAGCNSSMPFRWRDCGGGCWMVALLLADPTKAQSEHADRVMICVCYSASPKHSATQVQRYSIIGAHSSWRGILVSRRFHIHASILITVGLVSQEVVEGSFFNA